MTISMSRIFISLPMETDVLPSIHMCLREYRPNIPLHPNPSYRQFLPICPKSFERQFLLLLLFFLNLIIPSSTPSPSFLLLSSHIYFLSRAQRSSLLSQVKFLLCVLSPSLLFVSLLLFTFGHAAFSIFSPLFSFLSSSAFLFLTLSHSMKEFRRAPTLTA